MVLLVPFDGSDLSRAAAERGTEFSELTGEELVVLSVVTPDESFARERGWIEDDEPFDVDTVKTRLREQVRETVPNATVRVETTDEARTLASSTIEISRRVRQVAHELDASIVFVGSENAGRVATPITSVGTPVSEDPKYDVHIVRHAD